MQAIKRLIIAKKSIKLNISYLWQVGCTSVPLTYCNESRGQRFALFNGSRQKIIITKFIEIIWFYKYNE